MQPVVQPTFAPQPIAQQSFAANAQHAQSNTTQNGINALHVEQFHVVDPTTGEVVTPTAFYVPEQQGIELLNEPRDYRALVERERGYFSCNEVNRGPRIRMRILNYRLEHGVRFSTVYPEPETVVQVLFVDEQDLVSTIVFRTASLTNFIRLVDNVRAERRPLASMLVTATMERVTSKAGYVFHVVRFQYEPNTTENIALLAEFVKSNPHALTAFRQLPKEGTDYATS